MNIEQESRAVAIRVVETASPGERTELRNWAEDLLAIRNSNLTNIEKSKQALRLTHERKVIIPMIKILARQLKPLLKQTKKHMWDERSTKGRLSIAAATVGITVFGGQSAGIAALGGAIGVPLWVVMGAGAGFAVDIIEEVKNRDKKDAIFEYSVIKNDGIEGEV